MKIIIKASVFFSLLSSISIYAQVITDGSMGEIKTLSHSIIVPQNLGTTKGDNLFHSFKTFNINSNESVRFTGADSLKNVISRVTGGQLSQINGLLKSEIAHANFYFINPAGVFFGKDAHIDVPSAFHISSSDSLNFKDGHHFLADISANSSSLSISEPESFGFLKATTGNNGLIEISGTQLNPNYLNNKIGQSVDIVSGNININNDAKLIVNSGEIRLVATQGQATVSVIKNTNNALPLPDSVPSLTNAGTITLNNNTNDSDETANLDTSGNGGGHIALWAGKTIFTHSNVYADNNGVSDASLEKGIDIHTYSLTLKNSIISFDSLAIGHADKIKVKVETTDALKIIEDSIIKANTYTDANAGSVEVVANTLTIDDNNSQSQNPTGIYSQANITKEDASHAVTGNAGNVNINAKKINILNGGVIFTTTSTKGNAGDVIIGDDNQLSNLTIDASKFHNKTGIFSDANQGSENKEAYAGNIDINAKQIDLFNGGVISASTYSEDNAGNIDLQADNINIQGFDNLGNIDNGILATAIAQYTDYLGYIGNINIKANQSIHLYDKGAISIQNDSYLTDKIQSININVANIKLDNAGIITAGANGIANAGAINLSFSQALTMDNAEINTRAFLGNGGNISINGGKIINLNNQAQINTSTLYGIKGGDIIGNADILLMNNVNIQTQADLANNGGNIALNLQAVIASQNQLQTNGVAVANSDGDVDVLNKIKTAHSGILNLNAPQLNLSGNLGEIVYRNIEVPYVYKDNCTDYNYRHSALLRTGKGNVAMTENKLVYISPATHLQTTEKAQEIISPALHHVSLKSNQPCMVLF